MRPKQFLPLLCLFTVLVLLLGPGALMAHGEEAPATTPTTIFLVRHAEKATPHGDPPLSPAGRERARTLARMLEPAGIDAVYATQFRRTQETLEPLAAAIEIGVKVLPAGDSQAAVDHIRQKHTGQRVVLAGHSNTVPELIGAFGIADAPRIDDSQYDHLFIVTLAGNGKARLLTLRYGHPTP